MLKSIVWKTLQRPRPLVSNVTKRCNLLGVWCWFSVKSVNKIIGEKNKELFYYFIFVIKFANRV